MIYDHDPDDPTYRPPVKPQFPSLPAVDSVVPAKEVPIELKHSSHSAVMGILGSGGEMNPDTLRTVQDIQETNAMLVVHSKEYRTYGDVASIQMELESLTAIIKAAQLQWIQALNAGNLAVAKEYERVQRDASEQQRALRDHRENLLNPKRQK